MIALEAWSDDARILLRAALPGKNLEYIEREVKNGVSQLWHAKDETSDCYIVTRLEQPANEWVGVAVAGFGASKWIRAGIAIAKSRGISCRAHVSSKAAARLWCRLGLRFDHTVLRVA